MTIIIDSGWTTGIARVQGKTSWMKTKKVSRGKFIMSHHVYITWSLLATSPDPPRVSSLDKQTLFVHLAALLMDLWMTQGPRMDMVNSCCLHNLFPFLLPLENKWHSVRWRHHPPPYPQQLHGTVSSCLNTTSVHRTTKRDTNHKHGSLAFVVPNRYRKQNGQLKRATNKNQ